MKTTNMLLGIIAILLFCNFIKGTSFSIIPAASAQTHTVNNPDQIQKVQIVGIDPKVKIDVDPVPLNNGKKILPVIVVDYEGKPKK